MRSNMKICNRVQLRSEKEIDNFKQREENPIEGTPKIVIGKYENPFLSIWTEDLKKDALTYLKDLNSSQRALDLAKVVVEACSKLAPVYGYFIINENMAFLSEAREVLVWINPNIFENKVKIYLPPSLEGEQAMMRSIVSFLKLWLRIDYTKLAHATRLDQLAALLPLP